MTQTEVRASFIRAYPGVKRPMRKGLWYRCAHCGQWCGRTARGERFYIPLDERMEVDHIRPWLRGGSDRLYNLQPLCHVCNMDKGAYPPLKDRLKSMRDDIAHPIDSFIMSKVRRTGRESCMLGKTIFRRK